MKSTHNRTKKNPTWSFVAIKTTSVEAVYSTFVFICIKKNNWNKITRENLNTQFKKSLDFTTTIYKWGIYYHYGFK